MSQIWLHSDWHWRHENIYKFEMADGRVRREFANVTEGDAFIEQQWRDVVKPEDHVWCLGDVTMFRGKHQMNEFIHLFRSLPGHKRLILGNHDHYDAKVYTDAGFQKIRGSNMLDGVLLTHYPIHPENIGMRAIGNAHGHIHRHPAPKGPYFNCSVEANGYAPIPLETVVECLRKKQP